MPSRKAGNAANSLFGSSTDPFMIVGIKDIFSKTSDIFKYPSGLVIKAFGEKYGSCVDSTRIGCDYWNK